MDQEAARCWGTSKKEIEPRKSRESLEVNRASGGALDFNKERFPSQREKACMLPPDWLIGRRAQSMLGE